MFIALPILAFIVVAVVFAVARARGRDSLNDPHAPAPGAARKPASSAPGEGAVDDADVISMIRSGNKIDAIRMYRELHGTDLVTAKNAVEALAQTLKP